MPDLRDAVRALRANPVVSAVAILSLALGMGANTAIFSIVNALLLRSLPVKEPQQLVQLLAGVRSSWSNPLWEQVRERSHQLFDGAFAYSTPQFDLALGGQVEPANGMMASGEVLDVLGIRPILGRAFGPADDVPHGGPDGPVAVITYSFWLQRFGGAASAIGSHLSLDRVDFTVIGVTPPEFMGVDQGRRLDVIVPLGVEPLIRGEGQSMLKERSAWWLRVIARLKPGQTIDAAIGGLRGVQPQMRAATIPPNYRTQDLPKYLREPFTARPAATGANALGRQYKQPLYILMGVVALVLLIACANIANLLLARGSARRHELSVRVALGASSWRIARQMLMESAVIATAGAALGLLFANWGARLLVRELSSYGAPISLDVGLDWRVVAFTAAVAIATVMLFGTVPALRGTRVQPGEALKEQGRSIVGESRFGLGSVLVIGQVALSLVLVVGAGLFVRTFASLASVSLGFRPDPLLLVTVNVKRSAIAPADRLTLFMRIRDAVSAVPGVGGAAWQKMTPVTNTTWDNLMANPPGLSLSEQERDVHMNAVSPGWFAAYGTPILAGRDFEPHDVASAPHVVIVNETFAKKFFNSANPVGRSVRMEAWPGEAPPELHIIGLVHDTIYESLDSAVPPTMYQAVAQMGGTRPPESLTLAVQSASGSPALLSRPVAEAIGRIDGDVTLKFEPMRETIRDSLTEQRVLAWLSGFFGALALLLAAIGLYGVLSYAVSRRRTEIGIRMALGAGPSGAVRLILVRVAFLVAAGVVLGGALSVWATRFVSTLLFGLQPRDPATLAGAAFVLVLVGGVASWLPARRASRIDPASVLREG
jgi:predicted permease